MRSLCTAKDGKITQHLSAHLPALRQQARRLVLRYHLAPDLAQDLVQETCLQALRSEARFDPTRPAGGWLSGILYNVTRQHRDALRQLHRQHLPVAPADPETQASARQEAQYVLAPLSAADKEVLELAHVLEMTGAEMGRTLGVTPGAARIRLFRAAKRMRGHLIAAVAHA